MAGDAFGRLVTLVASGVYGYFSGNWSLFASALLGERQAAVARKAQRRARAAFNDAQVDRLQQVQAQPAAARRMVLGEVRLAGMELRRPFSHGTNSEKLTTILEFAGHEVDSFQQWYANDDPITLDVDGWCTTEPWAKVRPESLEATGTLNGAGAGTITLAATPVAGSVSAAVGLSDGEWHLIAPGSISVVGTSVSITGSEPDAAVRVQYQVNRTTYLLRIRPYTGTATQSVGADLAAEYGSNMRATDHYRGTALAVVDMTYDQDVFTAGPPMVSALVRGAKVYDRRADTTAGGSGTQRLATPSTWAYSENPAVLAAHYARHANGLALPADEINADDVDEAADWCDEDVTYTLTRPDTTTEEVTLPRHRAGLVISTDADPRGTLQDIINAMGGQWGMDAGILRLRAAMMRAPVATLDQSWIVRRLDESGQPGTEPSVRINNGVPRETRRNAIAGTCADPALRHQTIAYPEVRDEVLIAADGEMAGELNFAAVNHPAHAQHLASMHIRETMAGLRMELLVGLQAYALQLFDVIEVDLPRYGMTGKTMEVVGRRWHPAEGITLRLAEITEAMFTPQATLAGRDPAPNSNLPRPWLVEGITGLTVESNTAATADGSVLVRLEAEWDAATTAAVRTGKIELQYADLTSPLPTGDGWVSWEEHGSSTAAIIPGVRANAAYVVRARGVTFPAGRVNGAWCQHVTVSTAAVPLVGTGGLEPGAATVVYQDTSGAVLNTDVYAEHGVTPYYGSVAGVVAFTLDEAAQVLVTCSFDAYSPGSASAQLYGKFFVWVGSSSTQHAARVFSAPQGIAESSSLPMTLSAVLSLPAGLNVVGASVETRSGFRSPPWLDAEFGSDVTTKVEVIKR